MVLQNVQAISYPTYRSTYQPTVGRTHHSAATKAQMSSTSQSGFSTTMQPTIYEPFGSETPSTLSNGISTRRMGWSDDEELEGNEGGQQGPDGPIGDLPWLLMAMLLGGYAAWTAYRRKVAV